MTLPPVRIPYVPVNIEECSLIFAGAKREDQNSPVPLNACRGILRQPRPDARQRAAACACNYLFHSVQCIANTASVLRQKAFVMMFMAVEDQIYPAVGEHLPETEHLRTRSVCA